jgi:uncharacterized protein
MPPSPDSHDTILTNTRHWLTRAVIGLNLCPFAKAVHVKNQIRYAICESTNLEGVLENLEAELNTLANTDAAQIDTTLLIIPCALADFLDYNTTTFSRLQRLPLLRAADAQAIATGRRIADRELSSALSV